MKLNRILVVLSVLVLGLVLIRCGLENDPPRTQNSQVKGAPFAANLQDAANVASGKSTSRFAIEGGNLYTVAKPNDKGRPVSVLIDMDLWLRRFDIQEPLNPKVIAADTAVSAFTRYDNIVVSENKLFASIDDIYSDTDEGRFGIIDIYDITHPTKPNLLSSIKVPPLNQTPSLAIRGSYLFATLQGDPGQLVIYDISNLTQPTLIKSYNLTSPAGLTLDENKLFLCDSSAELIVYDATDPANLKILEDRKTTSCVHALASGGTLITSGSKGVTTFKYATFPMTELANLPLTP